MDRRVGVWLNWLKGVITRGRSEEEISWWRLQCSRYDEVLTGTLLAEIWKGW
jgi:hypothetical protein